MIPQVVPAHFRKVRSFVKRDSRITAGQYRAKKILWPQVGLSVETGLLSPVVAFEREAPLVLEIGFGTGQSFLAAAKAFPDKNFIGIETHQPGLGAVCLGIQTENLTNIRLYHGDAVDILTQSIPDNMLNNVQIFFPDPWQKRRHIPRRLIQTAFIQLVMTKLREKGELHIATDWEDYAVQIMKILSNEKQLNNLAGKDQFAERSPLRPIISKFEQRAMKEGRQIKEFRFVKI